VNQTSAAAFVALVAIVTVHFGRRVGIFTALASAIGFNFFFAPPVFHFSSPHVGEFVLWVSLAICALLLRPTVPR
jgi:K+-sensing histidine kinase KdpD